MKLRWRIAYWIMRRRKRYATTAEEIQAGLDEGWVDVQVKPGTYRLVKPLIISKACILSGNGAEFISPKTVILFSEQKKRGPVMIRHSGFKSEEVNE